MQSAGADEGQLSHSGKLFPRGRREDPALSDLAYLK